MYFSETITINSHIFFYFSALIKDKNSDNYVFINLTKTPDGLMWGDGTFHETTEAYIFTSSYYIHDSEEQDVYVFDNRKRINDITKKSNAFYFCQKNVFNF